VICWISGRSCSIRLRVNEFVSIRRHRACSAPSVLLIDGGISLAWAFIAAVVCGYPGAPMSALTRGSIRIWRCAAWVVTTHGVLPSHVRTRTTDSSESCSASSSGGGANGSPSERGAGNRGSSSAGSAPVTDVAHAVAYLASDEAGYVTGHTLSVNGGRYFS
jgi:hypothetical protein